MEIIEMEELMEIEGGSGSSGSYTGGFSYYDSTRESGLYGMAIAGSVGGGSCN